METQILTIKNNEVNKLFTYRKATVLNDGSVPFTWDGILKILPGDSHKLGKSSTPITKRLCIVFDSSDLSKTALITYQ